MISADDFLSSVANPQDYSCTVLYYIRGHLQLYIKAENHLKHDDFFILSFEQVWYYEGPMSWSGLNFRLGSLNEKVSLLEAGWIDVRNLVNEFAERNHLFIFERQGYKIQIFAGSFHVGKVEPSIRIAF